MREPPTVQRLSLPPWFVAVDRVLGLLHRLGTPICRTDSESIFFHARRRKRLRNWGDERFVAYLERSMDAVQHKPMTWISRLVSRQVFLKALSNRLLIENYVDRHPETLDIEIEKPLFVVGFPRTGTTLVQDLVSLEPGCRALRFWELHTPTPLLPDRNRDVERRVRIAQRAIDLAHLIGPEQPRMHELKPTTNEECWQLMGNTFAVLNFDLQSGLDHFGDWLLEQDITWAYAEYRRMLQVLAHQQNTRHFILKCPEHLWFLDSLLAVFPDAGLVWTHRDPCDSVASYCSMISLAWRMHYGHIDREALGRHISRRFLQGVERAMDTRDRLGEERFFDVRFPDLVADPGDMVRRIKHWHGLPHSDASDVAIQAFLDAPRPDARGNHVYYAEDYGLDPETLHRSFARYIDRYDIPVDHAG